MIGRFVLASALVMAACPTLQASPELSPRELAKMHELYRSSVLYPAYLVACDSQFPGYRARHETALARWREENKLLITEGERRASEYQARTGRSPAQERGWSTEPGSTWATAPHANPEAECLSVSEQIGYEDPVSGLRTLERSLSPVIRSTTDRVVARTAEEWAAAVMRLETDSDGYARRPLLLERLPAVDFRRSMVIGIALPTHSDSCTGVRIVSIISETDRLVVRYRERKPPGPNEGCATSFFRAYHLATVPTSTLPVSFVTVAPE